MHYSALSAIVSGGIMYVLGSYQANLKIADKTQIQPEKIVSQSHETITQENIKADTFANETVESITRTFSLNQNCIIHYSTLHKTPLAVHQILNKKMLQGTAKRADRFFVDPTLSSKNQGQDSKFLVDNSFYYDTKAYRNFNYNRGHMAAAGNYDFDQNFKTSTFSFANTLPQNGQNNGGIWNTFERYSRSLLQRDVCDTVQIVSGPIYHSNQPHPGKFENVYQVRYNVLKENGIMVPPSLYKIIKCNKDGKSYASGFVFPNAKTEDPDYDNGKKLSDFQENLYKIEEKTGLHFKFKNSVLPLSQIDESGLSGIKKDYDTSFYDRLVKKSSKVGQINAIKMRALSQGIHLNPEDYRQQIESLAEKQFREIQEQSESTICKKLSNQLSLYKNLNYLKSLDKIKTDLEDSIYEKIIPCRYSEDYEAIKSIKRRVERNQKRWLYPHDLFLRSVMGTFREPETEEKK